MGFFLITLKHTIQLRPQYFGSGLRSYIQQKLHADVEGTCSGKIGYIISVVAIDDISSSNVIPGEGIAEFIVTYKAITLKPYKNEVMDLTVTSVATQGLFCNAGPLSVFISTSNIPPSYRYDNSTITPSFRSEDKVITRDTALRVKMISTRVDATKVVGVGSILDEYLGPIST